MNNIFEPISTEKLIEILGLTIKRDENNKLLTFLSMLSAYTGECQSNLSFNAPSSSGKSFLPMETAKLFPPTDVIEIAYCSPTAFFHQVGTFDKEKGGYVVDLSRKILIFLDQPHDMLLQHLRPMLSHDKKEILIKITDKSQKAGLRTKNIILIGFPVVIFCTAGLRLDEQEATRFLLLSPEITQEKLREAIFEKLRRDADMTAYDGLVHTDPDRIALIERIIAIKERNVQEIRIGAHKLLETMFIERIKMYKPRHQRDIGRITSLTKVFALLNCWHRQEFDGILYANDDDVRDAFRLWDVVSESQDLNLPPYIHNLYKEIILPAYTEKNNIMDSISELKSGLTRQDILNKHFQVYGRFLPEIQLRQQILPMLKISGLIIEEADESDKRRLLIYPTILHTTSRPQNNSVKQGGVNDSLSIIPPELEHIDHQSPWAQYLPKKTLPTYTDGEIKQSILIMKHYQSQIIPLLGNKDSYINLYDSLVAEQTSRTDSTIS